jgi:hypothetical protein
MFTKRTKPPTLSRLKRKANLLVLLSAATLGATDWAEELELSAGRYVLTEANHAAWSCSIVIE